MTRSGVVPPTMLRPTFWSLMLVTSRCTTLLFVVLLVMRSCYAWSTSSSSSFLVTGANGYVGRALVHELLLRDVSSSSTTTRREPFSPPEEMKIFCLVRPQRVESEIEYWNQWQLKDGRGEHNGRPSIKVIPYDMLDGGVSFQAALQAASEASTTTTVNSHDGDDKNMLCVFHIASVFGPTENHQQTALDNLRGTEDLIETLAKTAKANRDNNLPLNCKLILTSSMAAVRGTGQEPINGKYYTCSDWNTVSQLGTNWGSSYQWSKAESERRAWELCRQYDIPMVSLCPSFVFGPPSSFSSMDRAADAASLSSSSSSSYSLTLVGEWARGESPVQSRLFVDVRDVALAHVEAAFRPQAVGRRYIVSTEKRVPSSTIASWIQELFICSPSEGDAIHDSQSPALIQYDRDFTGGSIPIGEQEVEAVERLEKELGVTLRDIKSTITEMVQILLTQSK